MQKKLLLSSQELDITLQRLCHQLIENHQGFENSIIIGLQPRGIYLANRIKSRLEHILKKEILIGYLDITFYRDDIRKELHVPKQTNVPFSIEGKNVVLIDDVLYTGRTIRAALDALMDLGRPEKVELCVLIDRRFSRQFPIQPDYVGKSIDSIISQKVKVYWEQKDGREEVVILE